MKTLKEIVVGAYIGMMTGVYILFLFISIIVFSLIIFFKKILTWKWIYGTILSMKKTRKPGSGRKKGSYSFCNITLEALNELLRPNMNVKVSRKWAVDLGLVDTNVAAVSDQTKKKVNVKVTEFEDDQTTNLDDSKVNLEVKETEW